MRKLTDLINQSNSKREAVFTAGYILCSTLAVIYLFRAFVFSSGMLDSGDVISGGLFFRSFVERGVVSTGWIPHWNSLQCCGVPFVDAIHGGVYYPLTYLEIIIGLFRGYGYSFMLHYVLAGTFAYWSARQMGLSRLASTLVGISYGFAPCLVSWVAPGHDGKLYVATWFPLVVGFAERVCRHVRFADMGGLALAIGITVLTGHVQLAYYVLWFLTGYGLFRFLVDSKRRAAGEPLNPLRAPAFLAIAIIIGLLISSIQIIPSATYILNDTPRSEVARGPAFAGQFSLHAEEMVSLAIPEFCGTNLRSGPWYYWGKNHFKDNSESASALAVFLAVLAFVLPVRRVKYFWGMVVVVVLLYAVGNATPVFRWLLWAIPALSSMEAPSGASFIAIYAISILAGLSVDRITKGGALTAWRRRLMAFSIFAPPLLIVAVATAAAVSSERLLSWYCGLVYPEIIPTGSVASPQWQRAFANLHNLTIGLFIAALTLTAASLVIWSVYLRGKWRPALWLLPLMICVVSIRFNERFINVRNVSEVFGSPRITSELQSRADQWRTLEYDADNLQLGFAGIASTSGQLDRVPMEYFDLIGEYSQFHVHNPRFINLTSSRYLVVPQSSNLSPNAFGQVPLDTILYDNGRYLLENRNCLPRVFLVDSCQVYPNRLSALDATLNGATDLRRVALLEEQPSLPPPQSGRTNVGSADIIGYSSDTVAIEVHLASNALLILTDNYFPAWKATVDGIERKIYRVDGSFRAVEVPAGSTSVIFRYESQSLALGKLLTLSGLFTTLVLFGYGGFRRRRENRLHKTQSKKPPRARRLSQKEM